ncbi:MAG: GPR endopeptidase [Clostridia bacterium]|nr:GPR endopeptidase [Clostridia bacterium]
MRQIRTDLAMESFRAHGGEGLEGVQVNTWEQGDVQVTEVLIEDGTGEKLLGKKQGSYITITFPQGRSGDALLRTGASAVLGEELSRLLPPSDDPAEPVLVVGLGNRSVTPDSLGPLVADMTLVTRHLFRELPDSVDDRMRSVCAVAPGVLGVTGLETVELVRGLVESVRPRAVIAVDALSARECSHLAATIQLSDTGIQPGSGVGNHRRALSRETLGVPVIAIGVPMVVHAATIVRDAMETLSGDDACQHEDALDAIAQDVLHSDLGEMIVTPREVDQLVSDAAAMVAAGVNRALHPLLSDREIRAMMQT